MGELPETQRRDSENSQAVLMLHPRKTEEWTFTGLFGNTDGGNGDHEETELVHQERITSDQPCSFH